MELVELVVQRGVGLLLFRELFDRWKGKRRGIRQREMIRGRCVQLLAKVRDDGLLKMSLEILRNYAVLLSVDGEIELGFQGLDGLKSALHSLDFLIRVFPFILFFRAKAEKKREAAALAPALRPAFRSDYL